MSRSLRPKTQKLLQRSQGRDRVTRRCWEWPAVSGHLFQAAGPAGDSFHPWWVWEWTKGPLWNATWLLGSAEKKWFQNCLNPKYQKISLHSWSPSHQRPACVSGRLPMMAAGALPSSPPSQALLHPRLPCTCWGYWAPAFLRYMHWRHYCSEKRVRNAGLKNSLILEKRDENGNTISHKVKWQIKSRINRFYHKSKLNFSFMSGWLWSVFHLRMSTWRIQVDLNS